MEQNIRINIIDFIYSFHIHRQFVDGSATPSNKSIVFDSFTNIHDEGMAFWITDGAVAETVSCFTYYNHISYAATRGGRLRSLVGNSSWGKYGVVSSGFSPIEKAREGVIEGLTLTIDVDTQVGSGFQVGERIRGTATDTDDLFIKATITGIPVCSEIITSKSVSKAPPPVKTIPLSEISALSSGGDCSSAFLID